MQMPDLGIGSRVTVTGLSVSPELAPFGECIATLDSRLFSSILKTLSLLVTLSHSLSPAFHYS